MLNLVKFPYAILLLASPIIYIVYTIATTTYLIVEHHEPTVSCVSFPLRFLVILLSMQIQRVDHLLIFRGHGVNEAGLNSGHAHNKIKTRISASSTPKVHLSFSS